jgi:hypothetical protein
MANRQRSACKLCTDSSLHNSFIEFLARKVRGNKLAEALGVSYKELQAHARHAGANSPMIPISAHDLVPTDSPVESLRTLQKEVTRVLSCLRRGSDSRAMISAISEARNLASELADLELKYSNAQGSKGSAFSKGEGAEILKATALLCDNCRGRFIQAIPCDQISTSS